MKYEIFNEGEKVLVGGSIQKTGTVVKTESNNVRYMPMSAQIVTVEHEDVVDGVYYSEILTKL